MSHRKCKDFFTDYKQKQQGDKSAANAKVTEIFRGVRDFHVVKVAGNCVFLPHLLANVKEKLYLCMQNKNKGSYASKLAGS